MYLNNKVEDFNSDEQAKIKIFKGKVLSYENIHAQAFDKLPPKKIMIINIHNLKYQKLFVFF